MKNLNFKRLIFGAIIAAVYVVLTVVNPLSFHAIQFRVSEILILTCFYNRSYRVPMIVGCLIANLLSPFGLLDVVFGTLATALAVIPMHRMKNIWLASWLPVFANAVIIVIMIAGVTETPPLLQIGLVGLGEFAVVTVVGAPLCKFVIEKNKTFIKLIIH
jgi:uncharacterized membrane protein